MRKFVFILFFITAFGISSQVEAQAADSPEKVIKGFYSWYIKELEKNKFPLTDNPAKMKQFISLRFYKETRNIYDKNEFDADYFISAQDYDKKWVDNLTISRLTKSKSKVSANILFKGDNKFNHKIKVTLILEKGAWKIDRVASL